MFQCATCLFHTRSKRADRRIYAPAVPGFRRIYYDEVKVAEGSDGYDLVAPDGAAAPAETGNPQEEEPAPPKAPVIVME